MITDFLIISCIGKDDKLGLRINKEFFIHNLSTKEIKKEQLVLEIYNFLTNHNAKLDEKFSVIVNQGPGSFSGTRISLAIAKGLVISKKIRLYGYKNSDLMEFNELIIEELIKTKLIEKKLIKPIYIS
tara:strand:+ start:2724 stop:3107 length:384 start_codon:yes stop_codon:yes gene_type:complete